MTLVGKTIAAVGATVTPVEQSTVFTIVIKISNALD